MASSLYPCGGRSRSNATRVRRATHGLTAGIVRSRRHVRMQSNRLRTNRLRARDAGAKEGLAHEQMDPGSLRRSCPSEPTRLCRLVPGIHDIQQLLFLVDRRARLQITAGIIPSAIFHPRQPSPANFFVIHGISSSSSFSLHRSCSPWEFTFRVFPFITKATQGLPCFTRSS
jgi:hypothetical protein